MLAYFIYVSSRQYAVCEIIITIIIIVREYVFFIVFENLIDVLLFVSQYRVSLSIRIDRDQLLLITKQGRNLHHNNFLFIKLSQLFR